MQFTLQEYFGLYKAIFKSVGMHARILAEIFWSNGILYMHNEVDDDLYWRDTNIDVSLFIM